MCALRLLFLQTEVNLQTMSSDSEDEVPVAGNQNLPQPGSQQPASQNKCDRIWKLMNADMRILGNKKT